MYPQIVFKAIVANFRPRKPAFLRLLLIGMMAKNYTVLKSMLDEIVRNGAISDTSLRMLVKKIIITERKGKLKIKIQLNADFSTHIDFLHDDDDPMYKSHGDILVEAR